MRKIIWTTRQSTSSSPTHPHAQEPQNIIYIELLRRRIYTACHEIVYRWKTQRKIRRRKFLLFYYCLHKFHIHTISIYHIIVFWTAAEKLNEWVLKIFLWTLVLPTDVCCMVSFGLVSKIFDAYSILNKNTSLSRFWCILQFSRGKLFTLPGAFLQQFFPSHFNFFLRKFFFFLYCVKNEKIFSDIKLNGKYILICGRFVWYDNM